MVVASNGGRAAAGGGNRTAASLGKRGLAFSAATALILVMSFKMLLHVVCASKLLVASGVCALDGLLSGVNLGVS